MALCARGMCARITTVHHGQRSFPIFILISSFFRLPYFFLLVLTLENTKEILPRRGLKRPARHRQALYPMDKQRLRRSGADLFLMMW